MNLPCIVAAVVAALGAVAGVPAEAYAQPADGPQGADDIVARATEIVRGAETAYVSDYISFAGADASGRVAFALDTNRGRADGEYQAEHFVAMYDELSGWVDVEGYTDFANDAGVLLGYPSSPYFEFTGAPYALEALRSPSNGLELSIGVLEPRVTESSGTTLFSMASAPATLTWNGRSFDGRLIYEYLAMRDANRLAGSLGDLLGILTGGPDFQGLYLAAGDGDFYIHDAPASAAASTGNPLMAFRVRGGERVRVDAPEFEVTRFDRGFGFYRWPAEWRVQWRGDCGAAELSVRSIDHETQTNWLTGGFAMRAVEGRISCGAETVPVFGFAELIR